MEYNRELISVQGPQTYKNNNDEIWQICLGNFSMEKSLLCTQTCMVNFFFLCICTYHLWLPNQTLPQVTGSQKCHTMKTGSHESLNNVTRMCINFKSRFRSKNVLMEKERQTKKHGWQKSANGVVLNYSWGHVWQLLIVHSCHCTQLLTAVYSDN